MEQLSKIGFHAAHRKYKDIDMFHELCAYQDTKLTPEEVAIMQVENAEMIDVITGSRECRYCKSYPFCCDDDWICLTPDNVKFEWHGLGKMGK